MKNEIEQKHALIDAVWVVSVLLMIKWILLKVPAMWTFAGPISLLTALAVATWRLNQRQQSWFSLELFSLSNKKSILIWTVIALVTTLFAGGLVGSLVNAIINNTSEATNQSAIAGADRFANVPGNWPVYLFWLATSWVIGGFTEEMLFRGFFILRFEKALGNTALATALAVFIQAIIFGQQHFYYQGIVGFFETSVIAIISGVIFILCKRRIWPLIISHGLANTLGMTLIFTGNA